MSFEITFNTQFINEIDIRTSRNRAILGPKMGPILSADSSKRDCRESEKVQKAPTINAAGSRGKHSAEGATFAQGEAQEAHVVRSGVQAHGRQGCAAAPTAEPHQAHLRSLPGHRTLPGGSQPPVRSRSGGGRASRAAAVPSLEGGPSARSPGAPPPRLDCTRGRGPHT